MSVVFAVCSVLLYALSAAGITGGIITIWRNR